MQIFLSVQSLRSYEVFKNNVWFTFFPLHENRDGHIAGLMEAKPEELGTTCTNRKDVPFYVLTILYLCTFSVGAIVKAL